MAYKHFKNRHTGKLLAEAVIELLEEYEIADRLLGITLDNAKNNDTMMKELETIFRQKYPKARFSVTWNQIRCLAHVINIGAQNILEVFKKPIGKDKQLSRESVTKLVVEALEKQAKISELPPDEPPDPTVYEFLDLEEEEDDELEIPEPQLTAASKKKAKDKAPKGTVPKDKISDSLTRVSIIVRAIRHSPILRTLMVELCLKHGVDFLVPIIDVRTRWNSTHDMLIRAIEFRNVIQETVFNSQDRKLIKVCPHTEAWCYLVKLVKVLEPLKYVTLQASKSGQHFSICNVLPLYERCIQLLQVEKLKFEKNELIYKGLTNGIKQLIKYYDSMSPICAIALILHPDKKQEFLEEGMNWKPEWVRGSLDQFQ